MAFSYVALPGQPALIALPDHAIELGGHEINHGGELRLLRRVTANGGAILVLQAKCFFSDSIKCQTFMPKH